MSSILKFGKVRGRATAVSALLVAVGCVFAWIFIEHKTSKSHVNLQATQHEILNDITVGADMQSAKSIMLGKYKANLVSEDMGAGKCENIFNISSGSDSRGVSEALVVVIDCRDGKVSNVRSEVGGLGL